MFSWVRRLLAPRPPVVHIAPAESTKVELANETRLRFVERRRTDRLEELLDDYRRQDKALHS
jgi:hypothetical protein